MNHLRTLTLASSALITALLLQIQAPAQADDSLSRTAYAATHPDTSACHIHPGDLKIRGSHGAPSFSEPCLVVQGDLEISGPEQSALKLRAVHGSIKIETYQGRNLRILSGLQSVGRNLDIEQNMRLTSLDGLQQLERIGGDLEIEKNTQLEQIDGLQGLKSIGGDLQLEENNKLRHLRGLRHVTHVGKDLKIEKHNRLESLDGLQGITSISGDLDIEHNNQLRTLDGLQNLRSIRGDFELKHNPRLVNLQALQSLESVGEDVEISNNAALCQRDATDLARRIDQPIHKILSNRANCR